MTDADKATMCAILTYFPTVRFRGIKRIDKYGNNKAMIGFDRWTDNSVEMHVWACERGGISRELLRECFRYAFEICGRGIALIVVECNNAASLDLVRRVGFRIIHVIKDGSSLGTDLAIQELRREECRWLRRNEVLSGKIQRAAAS